MLPRAAVPDPVDLSAELAHRLERALAHGPVDVLVLDAEQLGLPLLGSLLRDAVVVASADEPARVEFEVRSMALVSHSSAARDRSGPSSWPGLRQDAAEWSTPSACSPASTAPAWSSIGCARRPRWVARALRGDVTQLDAAKYRLVVALEACIDAAQHVVASEGLRRPTSCADTVSVLADAGLLTPGAAATARRVAGFRNVTVHGHAHVDDDLVVEAVLDRLDDLEQLRTELAPLGG